ncbi:hypothetical protein NDU88_004004 [Pleurodeles waltl]|uniref:Uncharacterized protein n=1 Tax=Pleurodeles waltl TaxID=8319 RepID=A0AAV7VJ10_PLEWA|nr:hypothetical protein NDU88_004004 [Pleurodeles waltl]
MECYWSCWRVKTGLLLSGHAQKARMDQGLTGALAVPAAVSQAVAHWGRQRWNGAKPLWCWGLTRSGGWLPLLPLLMEWSETGTEATVGPGGECHTAEA